MLRINVEDLQDKLKKSQWGQNVKGKADTLEWDWNILCFKTFSKNQEWKMNDCQMGEE